MHVDKRHVKRKSDPQVLGPVSRKSRKRFGPQQAIPKTLTRFIGKAGLLICC